jgi:hypothetical protein
VFDGEALIGPGMKNTRRGKPAVDQFRHPIPREAVLLAAPRDAPEPTMKIRMTKTLRFWVDVEHQHIENENTGSTKAELIARILREFEEAGDAMRYVNADGRVAWKATPKMLARLADAEAFDARGRQRNAGTLKAPDYLWVPHNRRNGL